MVGEIFQDMALREALQSERNMAAIGAANRDQSWSLNGMGEVRTRFDAGHFFQSAALQGANPNDPGFKPWLAKREDGDYARVKCTGTRIQSGFTAGADFDYRAPKFSKSYA